MDWYPLWCLQGKADKHCICLAPLYVGQPIAMYDYLHQIWIPAMVVHILPKDSHQVHTNDGTVYCHMRWHWCECSIKPADTVPDATIATWQAPTRPHVPVPHPTPTRPAQPTLSAPVVPTMLVTPKPQTTAVPTMPAVPKVTPVPIPVTPSIAPMQPRRSGHAHVAQKQLIQEM